jgi:hypothetical protein
VRDSGTLLLSGWDPPLEGENAVASSPQIPQLFLPGWGVHKPSGGSQALPVLGLLQTKWSFLCHSSPSEGLVDTPLPLSKTMRSPGQSAIDAGDLADLEDMQLNDSMTLGVA